MSISSINKTSIMPKIETSNSESDTRITCNISNETPQTNNTQQRKQPESVGCFQRFFCCQSFLPINNNNDDDVPMSSTSAALTPMIDPNEKIEAAASSLKQQDETCGAIHKKEGMTSDHNIKTHCKTMELTSKKFQVLSNELWDNQNWFQQQNIEALNKKFDDLSDNEKGALLASKYLVQAKIMLKEILDNKDNDELKMKLEIAIVNGGHSEHVEKAIDVIANFFFSSCKHDSDYNSKKMLRHVLERYIANKAGDGSEDLENILSIHENFRISKREIKKIKEKDFKSLYELETCLSDSSAYYVERAMQDWSVFFEGREIDYFTLLEMKNGLCFFFLHHLCCQQSNDINLEQRKSEIKVKTEMKEMLAKLETVLVDDRDHLKEKVVFKLIMLTINNIRLPLINIDDIYKKINDVATMQNIKYFASECKLESSPKYLKFS